MTKPPLITPRHLWYRERVKECLDALFALEMQSEWESYKDTARDLAKELLYCTTEWDKYYSEESK